MNALIILPAVLGILWSAKEWSALSNGKLDGRPDLLAKQGSRAEAAAEDIMAEMIKISYLILQGARSFLFAEYTYAAVYIVLFSVFPSFFMGVLTTIGYVVGAFTSIMFGWIGTHFSVILNVRTTSVLEESHGWLDVAIQGCCVLGSSLVSPGVLALFGWLCLHGVLLVFFSSSQALYEAILG